MEPSDKLNDGRSIPMRGFGTWKADRGQVKAAVLEAVSAGYRHIDCAAIYGNEAEVGEALAELFVERDNPKEINSWGSAEELSAGSPIALVLRSLEFVSYVTQALRGWRMQIISNPLRNGLGATAMRIYCNLQKYTHNALDCRCRINPTNGELVSRGDHVDGDWSEPTTLGPLARSPSGSAAQDAESALKEQLERGRVLSTRPTGDVCSEAEDDDDFGVGGQR